MSSLPDSENVSLPDTAVQFTLAGLRALGAEIAQVDPQHWSVRFNEADSLQYQGQHTLEMTTCAEPGSLRLDDRVLQWVLARLAERQRAVQMIPRSAVQGVNEITAKIFGVYQVPDGHVHLAGCSLEDRPILRISKRARDGQWAHAFYDLEQGELTDEVIDALGLKDLVPVESRVQPISPIQREAWYQFVAHQQNQPFDDDLILTVIWCKYAMGRIAIEIQDHVGQVEFSGWAAMFRDSVIKPPPFHCAHSGLEDYEVVVTDEGELTVPAALAVCDVSGRKLRVQEVGTCAATKKRVKLEFLSTCPVSGESILSTELCACAQCQQLVSPGVLAGGKCAACRKLESVRKDDPRIARILHEHPELDRWPKWRIAETREVVILLMSSLLKRQLVVLDKESLELRHAAQRGRFSKAWVPLPAAELAELAGQGPIPPANSSS